MVIGLLALAVGVAYSHSGINSIPGRFIVVKDTAGANDVPAQSDLTQMGRDDDSTPGVYDVLWSWDEIDQWTGSGQTGDACALFDSDADGKINKAVCARVTNPNADISQVTIVPQDATHPVFLFDCSDARTDRCSQPNGPLSYGPTDITAGALQANAATALSLGNLITDTDPFAAGSDNPHDSTLEVRIKTTLLPTGAVLANVCSYPSAGNGGNNNPFDCIAKPGNGFIRIVKVGGSGVTFDFTVSPTPESGNPTQVAGDTSSNLLSVAATINGSVTEAAKTGFTVTSASCLLESGASTGSGFTSANRAVSNIRVNPGEITTCTFNNAGAPTLTLVKTVTNDNGGTSAATAWTLNANKTGTTATPELTGTTPATSGATFAPGTYDLSESGPSNYTASAWSCVKNGGAPVNGASITLNFGDSATCTINNNDDAPSLTLVKTITNDNGGTAAATDWTLTADKTGTSATPEVTGSTPATSGATFQTGTYALAESGPDDYTPSAWSCVKNGGAPVNGASISLAIGDSATCTINNNDDAPSLTLVKTITNDNGGTAAATDWTLTADKTGTSATPEVTGSTPATSGATFQTGTYALAESGPDDYTPSAWSCVKNGGAPVNGASISLAIGDSATCTINNNDDAPSLTLVKTITNDNGGTAAATDWTLLANLFVRNRSAHLELSGTTPVSSNGHLRRRHVRPVGNRAWWLHAVGLELCQERRRAGQRRIDQPGDR